MSALSIAGERTTGQNVRTQNVTAVLALANIVKSSLGPSGLDKMLCDEVGDVTVTNDGATILKQLEVEHPAAKVLVELANLQDQEVGDGTTSVVILASELLKQGNELVKQGIHPTTIISGFNLAKKEACKFIASNMSHKVEALGKDSIVNAARTSISSKIIGSDMSFFSKLAVDAISAVKTTDSKGAPKFPVSAITILKAHGKSIHESELVNGFALNCSRASQAMPTQVKSAKIALLDFDLRKIKLPLGMQVLLSDPRKLEEIRQRESDITKERIQLMLKAGVNVVLTTKGIDDQSMKLFVENKVMAVRRCKKSDLKHIAKACGGQILLSLADMEGDETIEASQLGDCAEVVESKVGDGELIYFKGCKSTRAQTIVLRGANDFMLDEVERSLHDCLCVIKRVLESKTVVPGGGACEVALSVFMEHLADTMGSREQLAMAAFAQSLLIIPKTLAVNGAWDATDLIAKLRSLHYQAQTKEDKADNKNYGLDLENGKVRDNLRAGVLEPAISKVKMIRFATEAAITILRIDDSIKMSPANNPNGPVGDHY